MKKRHAKKALKSLLSEVEADFGLLSPDTLSRLVRLAPDTRVGVKVRSDEADYRRSASASDALRYNLLFVGGYYQEMWIQEVVK